MRRFQWTAAHLYVGREEMAMPLAILKMKAAFQFIFTNETATF